MDGDELRASTKPLTKPQTSEQAGIQSNPQAKESRGLEDGEDATQLNGKWNAPASSQCMRDAVKKAKTQCSRELLGSCWKKAPSVTSLEKLCHWANPEPAPEAG